MVEIRYKICPKCGKNKSEDEYTPSRFNKKYGSCRNCRNIYEKQYRTTHKENIKVSNNKYYANNKDKINAYGQSYYEENKEERLEYHRNNYQENIDYYEEYYEKNKGKILENRKGYYKENKEEILEKNKIYREQNREKLNKSHREYIRKRLKNDPFFKLRRDVSIAINYGLKRQGSSKLGNSCIEFLDYSFEELAEHLEKQFEPWMNWNNHGTYSSKTWDDNDPTTWKWQIDHIIPHSKFKYSSMEDEIFKECWDLKNLRPYSAKQNVRENNKRI